MLSSDVQSVVPPGERAQPHNWVCWTIHSSFCRKLKSALKGYYFCLGISVISQPNDELRHEERQQALLELFICIYVVLFLCCVGTGVIGQP